MAKNRKYKIVCDTNIFYEIAYRRIDPVKIKQNGNKILASPINFIELASFVNERNFEWKREAAKAILKYADEVLDDPDRYLASLWGIKLEPLNINWWNYFKVIAEAKDIRQLEEGILDLKNLEIHKLNLDFINLYRSYYKDFKRKAEEGFNSLIIGRSRLREKGKIKYLNKIESKKFKEVLEDPQIKRRVVSDTYKRIECYANQAKNIIYTDARISHMQRKLRVYIKVFLQYIFKLGTTFAPVDNDWGDLELIIYIQNNHKFFTRERRWIKIFHECSMDRFLFNY